MLEVWNALAFDEKLYIIVVLSIIPVMLLGIYASFKVNSTFNKYSKVSSNAGIAAKDAARRMLDEAGLRHVEIQHVSGKLTDHYDPRTKIIALSDSTYYSSSIAAIGVACHEAGHAVQHDRSYVFSTIRMKLVPIVNFANMLYIPLIIVGVIIGMFAQLPVIGNFFVYFGVVVFGLSTLFALITLPTEFDASSRALASIRGTGYYNKEEAAQAKKVLSAAALTYIASFLMSLVQFLRFLLIVMQNTRRR